MNIFLASICVGGLVLLILYNVICPLLSKDYHSFWSPITIISAVFTYYCIIPFFDQTGYMYQYGNHDPLPFHLAALLNYVCILLGFKITRKGNFKNWNQYISNSNVKYLGIALFLIGYLCFGYARGFHFSIVSEADSSGLIEYGGLSGYLVNIFSCSYAAICMLAVANKNNRTVFFYIILVISLITYIFIGGRHRIVCLILSVFTVLHLFPKPEKINKLAIIAILLIAYLGFSIMEYSRTGFGISEEALNNLTKDQILKGSSENKTVYEYSLLAINYYNDGNAEFVYFAPILTALFFPLPRAIFPWKTFSTYGTDLKYALTGADSGSAYLSFTDAFISFGWFGIVLNGLFLGWLAALFWNNYRNNQGSIGAIILLGVFNAWCYEVISRGYLAANYCHFIFMIVVPFWFIAMIRKTSK